jgi:hypothetical protein
MRHGDDTEDSPWGQTIIADADQSQQSSDMWKHKSR